MEQTKGYKEIFSFHEENLNLSLDAIMTSLKCSKIWLKLNNH